MITLENIRLNKINIMMQKPLTNTSETCCVGDKEHGINNDRLNRRAILREFVEGYDCKELSRRLLKMNPYRPTFLDSDHLDRFYEFFKKKSRYNKEYWTSRGYTEEEAVANISALQSKYGNMQDPEKAKFNSHLCKEF